MQASGYESICAAKYWGFDGVDHWIKYGGGVFIPAKLKTADSSSNPPMYILECFLLFYPRDYSKLLLIPQTIKHLSHRDIDFYELLIFVGCWIYMACFEGVVDRRMWWSNMEVNIFEGEPGRLTKYMSLKRFEDILRYL